jgi:Zn-dependent protease
MLLTLLQTDPVAFLLLAAALLEAIALHEFAHALVADLQGDRLPRAMGRLTLNPIRHLDPLGTIFLVLLGFGWGRPVEFRPQALSSRRFGAALVAFAGPAMNLLLSVAAGLGLMVVGPRLCPQGPLYGGGTPIQTFLLSFMWVNAVLAIFNLLPIPPLDGSRLLTLFLPSSKQGVIFFLDRWGMLILIGFLFFGSALLYPIIDFALRSVCSVVGL